MKNSRLIIVISSFSLTFLAGILFLISKFLKLNLQVSQKYEEVDLSAEIANAESMSQISLVFLLILFAVLLGVLVTSSRKK